MIATVLALKSILTTAFPARPVTTFPEAWIRKQIGTAELNKMIINIQPDGSTLDNGPIANSLQKMIAIVITVIGQGTDAQKVQYGSVSENVVGTIGLMEQVEAVLFDNKTLVTSAYPNGAADGGLWPQIKEQTFQYDLKEKALYCMGVVKQYQYRRLNIQWGSPRNKTTSIASFA